MLLSHAHKNSFYIRLLLRFPTLQRIYCANIPPPPAQIHISGNDLLAGHTADRITIKAVIAGSRRLFHIDKW